MLRSLALVAAILLSGCLSLQADPYAARIAAQPSSGRVAVAEGVSCGGAALAGVVVDYAAGRMRAQMPGVVLSCR